MSASIMLSMAAAFGVTVGVLLMLLNTRLSSIALDRPNHRSLHTGIVPRTGGLAVMAGIIAAWIVAGNPWPWILPILMLIAISILDDVRSLPVHLRLGVQLLISAGISITVMSDYPWWAQLLVTCGITWMINLFNFMDGSDGLAGGMALFGFACYAVAAAYGNDIQISALGTAVAAASLAFLIFNFHPARIFLGDSGSVPLGLLAGVMGLIGWRRELWPAWFPILVFSPFIADASITLFKRLIKGDKVWQAHRNHYYQRLIQLGWGHDKTAIAEYGLMMAAGSSAIVLIRLPQSVVMLGLGIWAVIYCIIMWTIDSKWRHQLGQT